jgi:hypothetical protein
MSGGCEDEVEVEIAEIGMNYSAARVTGGADVASGAAVTRGRKLEGWVAALCGGVAVRLDGCRTSRSSAWTWCVSGSQMVDGV